MEKIISAIPFNLSSNCLNKNYSGFYRKKDDMAPSTYSYEKWTLIGSRVTPLFSEKDAQDVIDGKVIYLYISGLDKASSLGSYVPALGEHVLSCSYSFILPIGKQFQYCTTQYVFCRQKTQPQIKCYLKDENGEDYECKEWMAAFRIEYFE